MATLASTSTRAPVPERASPRTWRSREGEACARNWECETLSCDVICRTATNDEG